MHAVALSAAIYRALLIAYPREFRDEYGEPMRQVFRDLCREEWTRRGAGGLARLWLETLADLVATAWSEQMISVWHDIRYCLRTWRKSPGFVAVAVASLALGIGANSTVFSALNSILFAPTPFREPERLVMLMEFNRRNPGSMQAPAMATVGDYRRMNHVFEDVAVFGDNGGPATMVGLGETRRVEQIDMSPGAVSLLGVRPVMGRLLREEDAHGAVRGVMIGWEFWQGPLGGDPAIVGKRFRLDGSPCEVVGVVPPKATFLNGRPAAIWHTLSPSEFPDRRDHWLPGLARLKRGVSLEQAQAEMDVLSRQIEVAHPETNRDTGVMLYGYQTFRKAVSRTLYPLIAAVALVLLIACANVAGLLLARAASRSKEMALRVSLGARRGRIVRQLLTESVLLSLVGGAAGLVVALGGNAVYQQFAPSFLTSRGVSIDHRVLLFTLAVSIVTGLVFGLAPALEASRVNLNASLKEGPAWRPPRFSRYRWLRAVSMRNALVVGEMALALTLLAGAGLMINSVMQVRSVPLGFSTKNLVTTEVFLAGRRYWKNLGGDRKQVSPESDAFFETLLDRVRRVPGVQEVAMTSQLPMQWLEPRTFTVVGRPAGEKRYEAGYNEVTPNFFETLGIPLRQGRLLQAEDTAKSPWMVVVNETFARRYFPGESAVGQQILLRWEPYAVNEDMPRTIAGVVGDVRHNGPTDDVPPVVYASFYQQPKIFPGGRYMAHLRQALAIRTMRGAADYAGIERAVKQIVADLDRNEVVSPFQPLQEVVDGYMPVGFLLHLLTVFSLLALVLAAVGTYGMISYSVAERTHDIGLRVALGALAGDIRQMVLWQGLTRAAVGIGAGLAAAFSLGHILRHFLFHVTPTDPLTYGIVIAILLATALAASYLPARRATGIDPMAALRQE